jgi:hypothetical protein
MKCLIPTHPNLVPQMDQQRVSSSRLRKRFRRKASTRRRGDYSKTGKVLLNAVSRSKASLRV